MKQILEKDMKIMGLFMLKSKEQVSFLAYYTVIHIRRKRILSWIIGIKEGNKGTAKSKDT